MVKAVVLMVLIVPRALGAGVPVMPVNIHAGIMAPDVLGLLQSSPTFRAQCERIAAAHNVRVDVELVQTLGMARAETSITRYQAGAVHAEVRIAFGQDYRELVAHEFEHIIEQLDGVDLRVEAEHGRAWLVDARAFETRRASEAGRRVRSECEGSDYLWSALREPGRQDAERR